ncbi:MAG: DUF2202 domain-containing protein [Rhodocyclaceae bacterium]|nr:DUF2202 domain-containing protein [Rhodocyclaceae bacterium]
MKTRIAVPLLAILLAGTSMAAIGAGPAGNAMRINPAVTVKQAFAYVPLSTEEANTLRWMREEEKLARDVYLAMYDIWQAPEFRNIARSEQRHFEAIGAKLVLFAVADPALPAAGQFANPELRSLYASLVEGGSTSYAGALRAGAMIEDLDIADLFQAIAETANPALKLIYNNLVEGSKNHLRAFVGRLEALGETYEPQYIDPVLFDAIIGQ